MKGLDLSVFVNLAGNLKDALKGAENEVGDSADRMNKRLKLSVGLAGGGLLASGVKNMGAGLIDGLTERTKEVQKAAGELRSLGMEEIQTVIDEGQALQSKFVGLTSDAFVRAAYDIKSGVSSLTDEGVAAMTASALTTAKATKGVPEEMTSLFATSYGIFKKQFDDMSDADWGDMFGASLAKSVQQFKTDGAKMQAAIESAGAGATNLGASMTEQMALLGMMQQQMAAGEAGTALRAFATNAFKADTAFAKLAKNSKNPVKVRILDESGQLRAMPDILTDLKARYGETLEAAEAAEIKDAFGTDEAMRMINALYGKEEAVRANVAALEDAAGAGAKFTEAMADNIDNYDGAGWELFTQKLDVLKQKLGAGLLPALDAVTPALSSIVEGVASFAAENPELVAGIGAAVVGLTGFAAVAAPVLFAASSLVAGFGLIKGALTGLRVAMLANPVLLIIAGIATAAYLIYQNWDGIKAWFSDLWGGVKNAASMAWEGIKNVLTNYTPHGLIYQNWDGISAWFSNAWDTVKTAVPIAWEGIKIALLNYTPHGLIYQNWDGISEWFGQKWDQVKTTFTTKWAAIKATVQTWKNDLKSIGSDMVQGLLNGIQAKWNALKAKISEMADMLPNWLKKKLGIKSPSRVFMGLGGHIGDGLAIGIDQRKPYVVGKMDGIRKAITAPMRGAATVGVVGAAAASLGAAEPAMGAAAQMAMAGGPRAGATVHYAPSFHITLTADAVADPETEAKLRELFEELAREQARELERLNAD